MRFEDFKVPILLSLVVLVVPIAGCPDEGEDDYSWMEPGKLLFELTIDDIMSREVEGTVYYDVYITIENILYTEIIYNWTELEVKVSDRETGFIAQGTPQEMAMFPGSSTDIQFFYQEYSGHVIWADPLDQIIVTYLTEDNEGDAIGLTYDDEGGAWVDLPEDLSGG